MASLPDHSISNLPLGGEEYNKGIYLFCWCSTVQLIPRFISKCRDTRNEAPTSCDVFLCHGVMSNEMSDQSGKLRRIRYESEAFSAEACTRILFQKFCQTTCSRENNGIRTDEDLSAPPIHLTVDVEERPHMLDRRKGEPVNPTKLSGICV